ncbi:hypothetical protein MMC06_006173 [Schaereria dolodes]|nr:hypothetical protein [Schaereria dolodes]
MSSTLSRVLGSTMTRYLRIQEYHGYSALDNLVVFRIIKELHRNDDVKASTTGSSQTISEESLGELPFRDDLDITDDDELGLSYWTESFGKMICLNDDRLRNSLHTPPFALLDDLPDFADEGVLQDSLQTEASTKCKIGVRHGTDLQPLEEYQISDERVNRLVAAITQGRSIHFSVHGDDGIVNAYTTAIKIASMTTMRNVNDEVDIQDASPTNLSRISRSSNRLSNGTSFDPRMTDEPQPCNLSKATDGNNFLKTLGFNSSVDWKTSMTWDCGRTDRENGVTTECSDDSSTGTVLRIPKHRPSSDRDFIVMQSTGPEWHTISPIPFDLKKTRNGLTTPSIYSNWSEQDCSSPLFQRASHLIVERSKPEAMFARPSDPVLAWLNENTHMTPCASEARLERSEKKDIEVWEDISNGVSSPGTVSEYNPVASNILKDITNLHRPGYLQRNSFFQESKANGKTSLHSRNHVFDQSVETTSFNNSSDHTGSCSKTISITKEASKRAADLAYTLAALEGRIPGIRSASPIRRDINPTTLYGANVVLDWHGPKLHQPQPLRFIRIDNVLEEMENFVEQKFRPKFEESAEDYISEGAREWLARCTSPNPHRTT